YRNEDFRLELDKRSIEANLLVNNPDALWNRAIAARVAFSHFLHWRSEPAPATPKPDDERSIFRKANSLERKTLARVLSEHPDDFPMARVNQIDMGQFGDRNIVARRSKMFQRCIEASPPRRNPGSMQPEN
ncbi:MAG: hypothetical protein WAV72_12965, partial [Bradyrhizobium sp.]